MFSVEEMPDREAVRARFGGGQYEVLGRDRQRIAARTRFVLEGEPVPLHEEEVPASKGSNLRRFATAEGEREALVFGLFREGKTVQEITEMTYIESRLVRRLYPLWLTPANRSLPTTPEELSEMESSAKQRTVEAEYASWESSSERMISETGSRSE